nr:hypothetical protein P9270_005145 [Mesorhizobium sp. WSM4875]
MRAVLVKHLAIKPSLDGNVPTLMTYADLLSELSEFLLLADGLFAENRRRKYMFLSVSRSVYNWLREAKIAAPEQNRRGPVDRDGTVHLVIRRPNSEHPLSSEFHPSEFIRAVPYEANWYSFFKTDDPDEVGETLWNEFGPAKLGWPGKADW